MELEIPTTSENIKI